MKASKLCLAACGLLLSVAAGPHAARAETGHDAWLRYAPLDQSARRKFDALPASTVLLGDSEVLRAAQAELIRGIRGTLGRTLRVSSELSQEPSFVLGTFASLRDASPAFHSPDNALEDSFWLTTQNFYGFSCILITAPSDRGVLYGVFALLSKLARNQDLSALDELQLPYAPLRWADQWDNLDGSIERGYAGPSIFFENGSVRTDLTRAGEYARLLASVGINGCAINNVNADPRLLAQSFLPQLARIAGTFRPWGVRLSLAVDLSSPQRLGDLDTFDPLDPRVITWWREKIAEIYRFIPDFAGFVVKADSEGRLGPSAYGRTPADAANLLGAALRPHGGVLFYRAFVYDHHLDWRDPKNDRAKAAYDIFHPLDGKFAGNVVIQIKYGPIDFQVREPVSPLLSGLEKTNEAIELQITQEYTGQQRHLCFLAPMWKEILDFDLHTSGNSPTPVKDLVSGRTFHRPTGGLVGVINVGMDANWLAHPLAMANLYAFGRLAWNPDLSPSTIAEEWTRLTFGNDPLVVRTISSMQLSSWRSYETYTGPLGLQTLTNILGSHYGPGVESSERNGWGQWHNADDKGVGMDRTVATGTGYVGQYRSPVSKLYESPDSTPDDLLLFFHHVPYTHALHSGKTVIQYIYDSHYEGAEHVQEYVREWQSLRGRIDDERYSDVLARTQYQSGHAIVWRDAICNWFFRASGIPDAKGRVGHHPHRIEAEAMQLEGYVPVDIVPWENASGGKGIECPQAQGCAAKFRFTNKPGWYEIDVQYFDQNNGASTFRLSVNGHIIDEWLANDRLPATAPGGDSSTRRRIFGVALRGGDAIRIEGIPDAGEHAPLDYVEILSNSAGELP